MTVSELIEKLKTMPQDAKVILVSHAAFGHYDQEVRDVIYNDPKRLSDPKFHNTVELDNWPAEGFLR